MCALAAVVCGEEAKKRGVKRAREVDVRTGHCGCAA